MDLRDTPTSPQASMFHVKHLQAVVKGWSQDLEDEAVEDEAAVAVREAVSRAAAEAGVDVSRETDPLAQGTPIDEL